jgi:adenosine deaminase
MDNIKLYDLHVHFGGSIPVEIIWDFLKQDKHEFDSIDTLYKIMTYKYDLPPYDFEKFLRKFDILNMVHWTEDRIAIAANAVAESLANQGTSYAEVRFSINKYTEYLGMNNKEVIVFICNRLSDASKRFNIELVPILCVKYENDRDQQCDVMKLIDCPDVADKVAGLDLVGDEKHFSAKFYAPIFAEWRNHNRGILAHVGESQTSKNVKAAIEEMHVNRISHGIKVADDLDTMKLANDNGVAFDVALTSNLKTGVVADLRTHPIVRMLDAGCIVSLGTDDPIILDTTIKQEYLIAKNIVGLSDDMIIKMKQNAISKALL